MIFDKNDEAFVVRAADAARRSDLIRSLGFLRGISFVVMLICGVSALMEFFWEHRAGSAGVCAASAIVFFVVGVHTDAQVKALKLFSRLSSINSVQPTAGRSAPSGR